MEPGSPPLAPVQFADNLTQRSSLSMTGVPEATSDKAVMGEFTHFSQSVQRNRRPTEMSRGKLTAFVWSLCCVHEQEMKRYALESLESAHFTRNESGLKCTGNHHYLYTALRLCYDLRVRNKLAVSTLLREIYLCEGALQAVFSVLIKPRFIDWMVDTADVNIDSYTLYPGKRMKDQQIFEYFISSITFLPKDPRETETKLFTLEHLLNMPIRGTEGITPLVAAAMHSRKDALHFLLRMGADPLKKEKMGPRRICALQYVVDGLNVGTLIRRYCKPANIHKNIEFLELFARSVYVLDIRQVSRRICLNGSDSFRSVDGPAKIVCGVNSTVCEFLDLQSYRQPPSLQHACRVAVRGAISRAQRETVFSAVQSLPLPHCVQQYLDLRF